MKTDNLTASEAERAYNAGYKIQPSDWNNQGYLDKNAGFNGFKNHKSFRLVTTDEDVAKWRETHKEIELIKPLKQFQYLDKERKDFWRNLYNLHLTTLPELTEGKPEHMMGGVAPQPSATVSDEVIAEWFNNSLHYHDCLKITGKDYFTPFKDEIFDKKALIRQAYHKAHEKTTEEKQCEAFSSEWLEKEELKQRFKKAMQPAPQAYKFPYKLAVHDNFNLQFVSPENVVVRMGDLDGEDLHFICEAINEKRQRDGKH